VVVAPPDEYEQRLKSLGCITERISLARMGGGVFSNLGTLVSYYRLLQKWQPDVILNFTVKPVVFLSLVATTLKIPVVNTITGLGHGFLKGRLFRMVMIILYRLSQRGAAKVIFQNEADRAIFISEKIVRAEKTMLVSGSGVDTERFSFVRRGFVDPVRFLFIGRLIKDKGITEFVTAAKMVQSTRFEVEFTVLGSVDEQHSARISSKELESLFFEAGIVHYQFSDQVEKFLSKADCVVLPSYREGTSRVLLEAAAMGTPIITTDVPGCREVVRNQNGLMCAPQDSTSLATRMAEFISMSPQEKQAMGRKGRELAEEFYAEEGVTDQYIRCLESLKSLERK